MTKRKLIWGLLLVGVIGAVVYGSWANRGRMKRVYAYGGIYELDLTVQTNSREQSRVDGEILKHWRMDIPNAYIYKHFGLNGVPGRTPSGKINQYGISLDTIIDPETMTLKPHPNRNSGGGEYAISIRLRNGGGRRKYEGSNRCLKPEEIDILMGRDKPTLPPCTSKRCRLYTHVDGWSIEMSVLRKFYDNPETTQQFCEATKELLQSFTVSRDSLLYDQTEQK